MSGNECSSTETKWDVRKTCTKARGSNITNVVAPEIQFRQRRILTVNQTQSHFDKTPYQSKKIGWHAQITYKMYKLKNRKFWVARLYVRECIANWGSSSITNLVARKAQSLQRLVLAANRTETHLANAHNESTKSGGAKRNVFMNENSFTWWKSDVQGELLKQVQT